MVGNRYSRKREQNVQRPRDKENKVQYDQGYDKTLRLEEGTFHAKMGSIKDRNGMSLIQSSNISRLLLRNSLFKSQFGVSFLSIFSLDRCT